MFVGAYKQTHSNPTWISVRRGRCTYPGCWWGRTNNHTVTLPGSLCGVAAARIPDVGEDVQTTTQQPYLDLCAAWPLHVSRMFSRAYKQTHSNPTWISVRRGRCSYPGCFRGRTNKHTVTLPGSLCGVAAARIPDVGEGVQTNTQ